MKDHASQFPTLHLETRKLDSRILVGNQNQMMDVRNIMQTTVRQTATDR